MSKRFPKFEALVVNAIRRLQAAQGSTATEIANYLQKLYDVSGPDIRRQINLTIRRGISYGILEKSKRGYTTCERTVPEPLHPQDLAGCYTACKRKGRSSRPMKRGQRRSRKGSSRRSTMKRRAGRSRKMRTGRKAARSPKKHLNPDAAKSKKPPSPETLPYGRQPSTGSYQERSTSKSPSRSGDDKNDS